MIDPYRGTGRTTRDLEQALARMREGHNVLFLIHSVHFIPHVLSLLDKMTVGMMPSRLHTHREYVTIDGQKMNFVTNSNPDRVRGWKMENVFTDHHFYEGILWRDWEWFWQLRH
jgi:hypothetical protein